MRYVAVSLLAIMLLAGCGRSTRQQARRYQILVAPSGQVFRLDTSSGEVVIIEKAPTISDGRTKLVVGSLYETEGVEVLRYVGNGKFEPRRLLSDFEKK